MANLNLKIIIGDTELAQAAYDKFEPILSSEIAKEVSHRRDADFRLVFGGDGTALKEGRQDLKHRPGILPPIFGIKAGNPKSKAIALNPISHKDPSEIIKDIRSSKSEIFHYLKVVITNIRKNISTFYALNEVNTWRNPGTTAYNDIYLNGTRIMERVMGDGIIVCTPKGSTGYNLKAGGSVCTDMGTIQVTGICSDFPSLTENKSSEIKIVTLESEKRPQCVEIDGRLVRKNILEVSIMEADRYSKINFIPEISYQERMIQEALRNKWWVDDE
jgi:NAD+ kinase